MKFLVMEWILKKGHHKGVPLSSQGQPGGDINPARCNIQEGVKNEKNYLIKSAVGVSRAFQDPRTGHSKRL
jgi:hypothetical protein